MKKTIYLLFSSVFVFMMMVPVLTLTTPTKANAQVDPWGGQNNIENTLGLGNRDPREIIASVINIALGFLGIIAVVLILLGGFKWMTAQGNDDKVAEAKKLMSAGVIGLVIILSAYGIATFVLNSLLGATGSGNATP